MKYQLELNDYDVDFLKLCVYGFREYQKNQIPDIKSRNIKKIKFLI